VLKPSLNYIFFLRPRGLCLARLAKKDLRLSTFYSLDRSAPDWTRALIRRGMGFLDCLFGISTHLAGRAAQSRLATDHLAADTGNRLTITLRDLFRGRKIVAQTLCIQHLLHLNDASVAKRCGRIHYAKPYAGCHLGNG